MSHADVVIAAPAGDAHGDCLLRALTAARVAVVRLSGASCRGGTTWMPGERLALQLDGEDWSVDAATTVWWRRPGRADTSDLDELEGRFVAEELDALLPGVLGAVGVRWVDAPWVLSRARLKLVQLVAATDAGCAIPPTCVTGDPHIAAGFAHEGPVVAKALSSGIGIAPHVDAVPITELHRVAAAPTMLQRLVHAEADLRIVTVGPNAFGWARPRVACEPLDWRAADPGGTTFAAQSHDPTDGRAVAVAEQLGLTFSVQDWLQTGEGPVFLEVNPQGQWLFLDGAEHIVAPALAQHLSGH